MTVLRYFAEVKIGVLIQVEDKPDLAVGGDPVTPDEFAAWEADAVLGYVLGPEAEVQKAIDQAGSPLTIAFGELLRVSRVSLEEEIEKDWYNKVRPEVKRRAREKDET